MPWEYIQSITRNIDYADLCKENLKLFPLLSVDIAGNVSLTEFDVCNDNLTEIR